MLIRTVFTLDRPFLDKALNFFDALRAKIFYRVSVDKVEKTAKQAVFL